MQDSALKISSLPERLRSLPVLIAQKLSDDEISARPSIIRNMVRNHVSAIYRRLGFRKRTALVI